MMPRRIIHLPRTNAKNVTRHLQLSSYNAIILNSLPSGVLVQDVDSNNEGR